MQKSEKIPKYKKMLNAKRVFKPVIVKTKVVDRAELEAEAKKTGGVIKECPACKKSFVAKPDILGFCKKRYCNRLCIDKAKRMAKTGTSLSMNMTDYYNNISRPVYSEDLKMSFTSVHMAARYIGCTRGDIYMALLKKPNKRGGNLPDKKNYNIVDYDPAIHPMPRHQQPWLKMASSKSKPVPEEETGFLRKRVIIRSNPVNPKDPAVE